MTNVPARRSAATALRRFAAGLSTVGEFERDVEYLDDDATQAFFLYAWTFYDDFRTERLSGAWRLPGRVRRDWARWALYLATDAGEYPWLTTRRPRPRTGGVLRRLFAPEKELSDAGFWTKHWPFLDRAHLREAERRYLTRDIPLQHS